MLKVFTISFLIISLLLSCRGVRMTVTIPQDSERSHMIAIFMDGTRDRLHKKPWRNSHVNRVRSLAFDNIKSLYVEGVGTGIKFKDAKYAITTKERVMRAYRFLAENYKSDKDSICLFGFSRGANQCRILSSIIYTIGIIDLNQIKESDRHQLLRELYDQYLDTTGASGKKYKLATFLNGKGLRNSAHYDTTSKTMIELLGLWDTVEAFIIKDTLEMAIPRPEHLNQLYNVKKFFHAVSLDDNRAFTYTPILATHKEVALRSDQNLNSIVEEVWFNGSHKDVGGGVRSKKRDQLSGISLKWMLSRLRPYHILRDTIIETSICGNANDMRKTGLLRKTSPGDSLRAIDKYLQAMEINGNQNRIKVHQTVIDRLAHGIVPEFKSKNKYGAARSDWYDWKPFKDCFTEDGKKRIFLKEKCSCIEVVNDSVTATANVVKR